MIATTQKQKISVWKKKVFVGVVCSSEEANTSDTFEVGGVSLLPDGPSQ